MLKKSAAIKWKAVWLWVGGVMLIMAGVGSVAEYPVMLAAPLLIASGGILLPPVWRAIGSKAPGLKKYSVSFRALAVLVAVGVVGALAPPEPDLVGGSRGTSLDPTPTTLQLKPAATVDQGDAHEAWAYMQQFVRAHLKSPRSADFPFGGYRDVAYLGGGRHQIISYVDAQNSFGADIRTRFDGIIRKVDDGWELESLVFEE